MSALTTSTRISRQVPATKTPSLLDRLARVERNLSQLAGWAAHRLDAVEADYLHAARGQLLALREDLEARRVGYGVVPVGNDTIAANPWPDLVLELEEAGIPDDLHVTLVEDR